MVEPLIRDLKGNDMKNGTHRLAAGLFAGLFLLMSNVSGQTYPDKPIKLIVPYAPGGATDLVARAVGREMSRILGQPILVENRPGNVGAVAADFTAKSAPDGYTLCMCTDGPLSITPTLQPTAVTYRTARDFMPVSLVNLVELGLFARAGLPASNLAEVVAAAKAAPGKLTYATASVPGPNFLAFEAFMQRAGVQMLNVPYKGDGPAIVALAGGEVDLFVGGIQSALPMIQAGRVKGIAMTGMARSKLAPNVATVNESGYLGFEHNAWAGVVVPAGTSPSIINQLRNAVFLAIKEPAVIKTFESNGLVGVGSTPEEFRKVIEQDTVKFAEVIKRLNLKLD